MNLIDRNATIIGLFILGRSMAEIGRKFGLTREMVRVVLRDVGLTGKDANFYKEMRTLRITKEQMRERVDGRRRIAEYWIGLGYRDPRDAYFHQKQTARDRRIEFNMTFEEWMAVWGEKYGQRGRSGLVMCRKGDVGPYSVENVYLATTRQNVQDYFSTRRSATAV